MIRTLLTVLAIASLYAQGSQLSPDQIRGQAVSQPCSPLNTFTFTMPVDLVAQFYPAQPNCARPLWLLVFNNGKLWIGRRMWTAATLCFGNQGWHTQLRRDLQ
jgi:hypothetical protein